MTMPQLINCEHAPNGWCLDCVGKLYDKKTRAVSFLESCAKLGKCENWDESSAQDLMLYSIELLEEIR